ncbi:hypothetical protein [Elizabethkingia meningoseptica]|uniref:hypothetical protein n=1 Tax=Elizabethkingia meningoseptica TaxID=238 RepID=UPI0009374854|nr:hypothetical protein [Elizabethkingia meningoseptica]
MDEDYQRKRILVQKVFEKAGKEIPRKTPSAIADYLSPLFEEKFGILKDPMTYSRYYRYLIKRNEDYTIDDITKDQLSKYLGYKDFNDFSQNISIEKEHGNTNLTISINEDEESLSEKLSKIIINITNAPVFNLSEFFQKKSNMAVTGVILAGSLVGGFFYNKDKQEEPPKITLKETFCMYWAGDEYKITNCSDKDPHHNLKPFDSIQIKYFKRITQPDTLTPDNAMEKVWYSKLNNQVDFFTSVGTGTNPGNDAKLKPVTPLIIEKYAHENK